MEEECVIFINLLCRIFMLCPKEMVLLSKNIIISGMNRKLNCVIKWYDVPDIRTPSLSCFI